VFFEQIHGKIILLLFFLLCGLYKVDDKVSRGKSQSLWIKDDKPNAQFFISFTLILIYYNYFTILIRKDEVI
jgi:hypothetical protein